MVSDYNAHAIMVGSSEHINADTNLVSPISAYGLPDMILLANDLRAKYTAHIASLSEIDEACALLNEIKADYNLHIADTDYHAAADSSNANADTAATT